MKKVLVVGATGQLGQQVIKELKHRSYWVRALARNPAKLEGSGVDEIVKADLTDPASLKTSCQEMDWVFSCAGAVMNLDSFRDRKSFYEIDFQGNCNLLAEAQAAGVKKFGYVSLLSAEKLLQTEYADAHEKFVTALKASGLDYTVIRPTGFFSFLLEILKFAQKGRGLIIGSGECRTNPIHEKDLAKVCVEAMEGHEPDVPAGGPEIHTRRQCTELAFEALNQKPKLMFVSPGFFKLMIAPLRFLNRRWYALMDFGIAVTQIDVVAPSSGSSRLKEFFQQAAKHL